MFTLALALALAAPPHPSGHKPWATGVVGVGAGYWDAGTPSGVAFDTGYPKTVTENDATTSSLASGSIITTTTATHIAVTFVRGQSSTIAPLSIAWTTSTPATCGAFVSRVDVPMTGGFPDSMHAAVWSAVCTGAITSQGVTATWTANGPGATVIGIYAFVNANATPGGTGTLDNGSGATVALRASATTAAGSWLVGALGAGNNTTSTTPRADTTRDAFATSTASANNNWAAHSATTTSAGTTTIGTDDLRDFVVAAVLEIKQ